MWGSVGESGVDEILFGKKELLGRGKLTREEFPACSVEGPHVSPGFLHAWRRWDRRPRRSAAWKGRHRAHRVGTPA